MKRFLLLWACAVLTAPSARAQFTWINCSFKAVLNPDDGTHIEPCTEAAIDATLQKANEYLAGNLRGYRLRRVGPLYFIGAKDDTTGPSKWYHIVPGNFPEGDTQHDFQWHMDQEAKTNALYHWNSNAINYYVLHAPYSAGSPPPTHIITLNTIQSPHVILHETGHWFDLFHAHVMCMLPQPPDGPPIYGLCQDTNVCPIVTNEYCLSIPPFADILPTQSGDYSFTNRDLISLANFAVPFTNCLPWQSNLVEDTFLNLMGYSLTEVLYRLTPLQLDHWTEVANDPNLRLHALSGQSRYVSPSGDDSNSGLTSTQPKLRITNAVAFCSLNGSDTVLLRPGNYSERFTITHPVTIRTAPTNSFAGYPRWATIGKP